jgi:hypothetical protein
MQDTIMASAPEVDISGMDFTQLSSRRERIDDGSPLASRANIFDR